MPPLNRFAMPWLFLRLVIFGLGGAALAVTGAEASGTDLPATPNVVVILADDLGWGDVGAMSEASAMVTPNIDRIAAEGMLFTDAHSPSAICSPTRYGLLTGRYAWRTRLQGGSLEMNDPPLIAADRSTLGTLLQAHGYRTGVIGKWHLGMNLPRLPLEEANTINDGINFSGEIEGGPVDRGFDEFYGLVAGMNRSPWIYIRNRHFTAPPSPFASSDNGAPAAAGFERRRVLGQLTQEAVAFIDRSSQTEAPFFLYFALTAPHPPIVPDSRYRNTSALGRYGDFVAQMDGVVGQVLNALERVGVADDTVVLFTSDNGSYMKVLPDGAADHVGDYSIHGYQPSRHRANGPWRGSKSDVYEGGHRVPLLVRWPAVVEAGSASTAVVAHTDLYATLADILGSSWDRKRRPTVCRSCRPCRTAPQSGASPSSTIRQRGCSRSATETGSW